LGGVSEAAVEIESLERLVALVLERPVYAALLVAAAAAIAVMAWYASAYIAEKARQRATATDGNAASSGERKRQVRGDSKSIPLTSQSLDLSTSSGVHGRALTMADGTVARADLSLTYRITNPYKATYEASEHPLRILQPTIFARVHQLLESYSLAEARTKRREAEDHLKRELAPNFERYGITLESITIGAMEAIGSAPSRPGTAE
jgi:hypothetical protein